MLTLKCWYITELFNGMIQAHGEVQGHYRLQDGKNIHTSIINNIYKWEAKGYILETASGSLYQLMESEMKEYGREETKRLIQEMGIKEDSTIYERVSASEKEFLEKKQKREVELEKANNYLNEHGNHQELYLLMDNGMKVVKAMFKYENHVYEIKPQFHLGMIQDSVLITDWEEGNVDFRYFPGHYMQPYHWSDGLEKVYIHNIGHRDFTFNGTEENVLCKTGAVTVITKDIYKGEGLMSPDAVNGKCMFTTMD